LSFAEFEPNATLFQYTSFDGFKGIIDSKSLWLSDLRSLNDPRELILGLGKVRSVVDELLNEKPSWGTAQIRKKLQRSYDFVRSTNLFTASFCPKGDSMPLWQHYGDAGRGVSIGFRPRAILDMVGRLQKVEYLSDSSPLADLKETLSEVIEPFGRLGKNVSLENELSLPSVIASKCTSIKHSTWDHEKEVRLVYSQHPERNATDFLGGATSEFSDGEMVLWREPSVRTSTAGEVKYIPFEFGKRINGEYDPTSAIAYVFVGSQALQSVPEVRTLLESEGFRNVKVLSSECIWR